MSFWDDVGSFASGARNLAENVAGTIGSIQGAIGKGAQGTTTIVSPSFFPPGISPGLSEDEAPMFAIDSQDAPVLPLVLVALALWFVWAG